MTSAIKPDMLKSRLVELDGQLKQLNYRKSILTSILNKLSKTAKLKPEQHSRIIYLQEEISYLDYLIKLNLNEIEKYRSESEALEKGPIESLDNWISQKNFKLLIKFSLPLVLLLIILSSLFFIKPSTTGYVVGSKESTYNKTIGLTINESGNYTLTLDKPGKLTSIKASGSVIGNGTVKIYIEKDGKKYLIYDNKQ